MEIRGRRAALRDFTLADLPGRLLWETVETEWRLWDAPWKDAGKTAAQRAEALQGLRLRLHALARRNLELGPEAPRLGFEVYRLDPFEHIGWVNAYYLDDACAYSPQSTARLALGLNIPPPSLRRQGYGTQALGLFAAYLLGLGHGELYTQTWSGNRAMAALAARLGFELHRRDPGARQVGGAAYDGLTFKLNIPRFEAIWQEL